MSIPEADNLIAVGYITGCSGVRGFIKVKPLTDSPARFEELNLIYRGFSAENVVVTYLESAEIRDDCIIVKLNDVNDKMNALQLKGQYLFITGDKIKLLDRGKYYVHDIIGCEVRSVEGEFIGTITNVYKLPGNDLWEIKSYGKVFLFPAVKEFIIAVHVDMKTVIVKMVEGLTDL